MRLRLYISESRLQTHEKALRRHLEEVSELSASSELRRDDKKDGSVLRSLATESAEN